MYKRWYSVWLTTTYSAPPLRGINTESQPFLESFVKVMPLSPFGSTRMTFPSWTSAARIVPWWWALFSVSLGLVAK